MKNNEGKKSIRILISEELLRNSVLCDLFDTLIFGSDISNDMEMENITCFKEREIM